MITQLKAISIQQKENQGKNIDTLFEIMPEQGKKFRKVKNKRQAMSQKTASCVFTVFGQAITYTRQ